MSYIFFDWAARSPLIAADQQTTDCCCAGKKKQLICILFPLSAARSAGPSTRRFAENQVDGEWEKIAQKLVVFLGGPDGFVPVHLQRLLNV